MRCKKTCHLRGKTAIFGRVAATYYLIEIISSQHAAAQFAQLLAMQM